MDFFDRLKQPGKYEVPVIEERDHPNKGRPAWNRGIPLTAEQRAKISAANKGKPSPTRGRPAWNRGIPHSAEQRAKISAANKGKTFSDETRAKMSASFKGRKHSEETRAKISSALPQKRACKTPLGVFKSVCAAARAHNLHESTVRGHLNGSKRSDWHFVEEAA